MRKNSEKLDIDVATVLSLWWGAGGAILGFVGIGISLYFAFAQKPDIFWLTFSGWFAAIVVGIVAGSLGFRLVKLAAKQGERIEYLNGQVVELKVANTRLIDIASFIAATHTKAKPQASKNNMQKVAEYSFITEECRNAN